MGRDPGTPGRSYGVIVEPTDDHSAEETGLGIPITGSAPEIAETIARFGEIGMTRVELMLWPGTEDSLDAVEPAIGLLSR